MPDIDDYERPELEKYEKSEFEKSKKVNIFGFKYSLLYQFNDENQSIERKTCVAKKNKTQKMSDLHWHLAPVSL